MVLAATMHKLSPILNAVVRDQAPRQQNSVPTVIEPSQPAPLPSNCLTEHGNPPSVGFWKPISSRLEYDFKSIAQRISTMLFTYPSLDDEERRVEEATTRLRHDLRHYMEAEPRRWTDLLARMTRARALIGSNSVEGINVSDEDAIAAIDMA